jgi:hypothetical protein
VRTASGLGPGFTATEGHQGLGASLPSAPSASTGSLYRVRAAAPSGVSNQLGHDLARSLSAFAGDPGESSGVLALDQHLNAFGAYPSTRVSEPSTPEVPATPTPTGASA